MLDNRKEIGTGMFDTGTGILHWHVYDNGEIDVHNVIAKHRVTIPAYTIKTLHVIFDVCMNEQSKNPL